MNFTECNTLYHQQKRSQLTRRSSTVNHRQLCLRQKGTFLHWWFLSTFGLVVMLTF